MTAGPTSDPHIAVDKTLKRTGFTGVAFGVVALIACELPLIFAVIGLSGLSATVAKFRPPLAVEIAAIGFFVLGVAALIIMLARRVMKKRRLEDE